MRELPTQLQSDMEHFFLQQIVKAATPEIKEIYIAEGLDAARYVWNLAAHEVGNAVPSAEAVQKACETYRRERCQAISNQIAFVNQCEISYEASSSSEDADDD